MLGPILGAVALSGCENPGESGVEAELFRIRTEKGLAVMSFTPRRAVFAARGERVAVEPPVGYCLHRESVGASRLAAFVMIADCSRDHRSVLRSGASASRAPAGVIPGILTVSISGEPGYDQDPQGLDDFEAFIETESGRKLLGRGDGGAPGAVIGTRRVGGALYVLIEGKPAADAAVLSPWFWRAFININDRLVLVTASSFSDRPVAEDTMMGFLAHHMARLREANRLPADAEEQEIARLMAGRARLASGNRVRALARSGAPPVATGPAHAPQPPARLLASARDRTLPAPSSAPVAPRRPG